MNITLKKKLKHDVYQISNYAEAGQDFIQKGQLKFELKSLVDEMTKVDKGYHFRIHKNTQYIFFGDIDHYNDTIDILKNMLKEFLLETYNLSFEDHEFKYTMNNAKSGSYHYSIPKWNASTEKLREIHINFINKNKEKLVYIEKKTINCIDTTIYSEHWFRCPNQSKGNDINGGKHLIINGEMEDFIITHIPKESININEVEKILKKEIKEEETKEKEEDIIEKEEKRVIQINNEEKNKKMQVYKDTIENLSTSMSQPELYKKMFDECYKQERFENYSHWIIVGMAIKNTFTDDEKAMDLFNYYSSKGSNYGGYEKTKYKFQSFKRDGYTVATIYYYAMEDNKPKFIEIMNKNTFELGQMNICNYLKTLAGHKFLYQEKGGNYILYCYNEKYWQMNDILLIHYLGTELYEFLKMVLYNVYWNSKDFNSLKYKVDKLQNYSFKTEIIKTYKGFGTNNDIKFDSNWKLLGFNNLVYDMELEAFRDYQYDDYISITTGYDWHEPTTDEITTMENLITSIMPIEDERNLYLQILSTTIEGRTPERFIIFNGKGGNGKGMIDDMLLLALGNYGLIGNNALLFETSKSGSNPEKANIHKKRLVLFREPPERNKFENSIIKEFTGGGNFSARTHHEKETTKELNATIIIECNKKPLFAEDPTDADTRRIIDVHFRSTFTSDENLLNPEQYIYPANPLYKTSEFQEKHKYALLKILMREHVKYYKQKNSKFTIPSAIKERTANYLELSCNILQWFKDNYELTNNKKDIIKIKDIFAEFCASSYYFNLTKNEKRKYNKTFFTNYFETNIYLKNYYCLNHMAYSVHSWKKTDNIDKIYKIDNIDTMDIVE